MFEDRPVLEYEVEVLQVEQVSSSVFVGQFFISTPPIPSSAKVSNVKSTEVSPFVKLSTIGSEGAFLSNEIVSELREDVCPSLS